jgi:malate dehydrogenase (oxaloacetate-decarboxylating)
MASQESIQDRLGRNIVFVLKLRLFGTGDPRSAVLAAVADAGAVAGSFELDEIEETSRDLLYDLSVFTTGDDQLAAVRDAIDNVEGVTVTDVIDVALETHRGGACEVVSRSPIESNTNLRIVYTPGVARVCKAIEANPDRARELTGIHNTVAIVTNGTAILGLGDIGAVAGMPVMEGKSAIFAEFADISAVPVLVDTCDVDRFVETVATIAPTFGAIQVEDVKAPECFAITRRLDEMLDIPVMHDDQHGTATIVLAGLTTAVRRAGWKMENLTCAISGAGASGTGITDLLLEANIGNVILCDSKGIVCRDRSDLNDEKRALAERTNRENLSGTLADAMKGAHIFIGCSQPDIVSQDMVRAMAEKPIVFPLANPVSEIGKDDALAAGAAVYADGRTMNNAIAYPGIFRGAMDSGCKAITFEMMLAAASALADIVPDDAILPEMMDPITHATVAEAVASKALGED